MTLDPDYGNTPLPFDEFDRLLPDIRDLLDAPITKSAVFDLEQAVQADLAEELIADVIAGQLTLDPLVDCLFLRDLHAQLFGRIWNWAGQYRLHSLNIGVEPTYVATELRNAIDSIRYRWEYSKDWSPRELGIAVHAECVRVHPFVDGNGRSTRLFADLVFLAAQDSGEVELYDWSLDKAEYIRLLRDFDQHRDPTALAAFVPVYKP